MHIWINIENTHGEITGRIESVLYWEQTDRLDRAGSFKTALPITEPNLRLIQDKHIIRCYGSEWN